MLALFLVSPLAQPTPGFVYLPRHIYSVDAATAALSYSNSIGYNGPLKAEKV